MQQDSEAVLSYISLNGDSFVVFLRGRDLQNGAFARVVHITHDDLKYGTIQGKVVGATL